MAQELDKELKSNRLFLSVTPSPRCPMNRRQFSKITALSAVGAASSSFISTIAANSHNAAKRSANERIQLALIGAKNQGGRIHLPTLVSSEDCQVVAICDVDSQVQADAIAVA